MKTLHKKKTSRSRTPRYVQMDESESGLSCLISLLAYYGRYLSDEDVKKDSHVSKEGIFPGDFIEAGRRQGLNIEEQAVEFEDLADIPLPYVLYSHPKKYLIIEGFSKGKVYINDSQRSQGSIKLDLLKELYGGKVFVLKPGEAFKKLGQRPSMRALFLRPIFKHKALVFYTFLCSLCLTITLLSVPVFGQILVDSVFGKHLHDWNGWLFFSMCISLVLTGVLIGIQQDLVNKLTLVVSWDLCSKIFLSMIRQPYFIFKHGFISCVLSTMYITFALRSITGSSGASNLANNLIGTLLLPIFCLVLFGYNSLMGVIGVTGLLLMVGITSLFFSWRHRSVFAMTSRFREIILPGAVPLKTTLAMRVHRLQALFFEKWICKSENNISMHQRMDYLTAKLNICVLSIYYLSIAAVVCVGGWQVIRASMTLGELIASQILIHLCFIPFVRLIMQLEEIQQLQTFGNFSQRMLEHPQDSFYLHTLEEASHTPPNFKGQIEIKNLDYGSDRHAEAYFKDFSLKIEKDENIGIYSTSPAMRTELLKVICALLEPWSGSITYDQKDYLRYGKGIFAFADLSPCFWDGSIRENLTFWNTDIPEEKIIHATKDVGLHEQIMKRQGGYFDKVSENATNFSVGQRAQLEIARALICEVPIIVMDNLMTSLGPMLSTTILKKMKKRGQRFFILSNDPVALRQCDRVLVLDGGKILVDGTFHEVKEALGVHHECFNPVEVS